MLSFLKRLFGRSTAQESLQAAHAGRRAGLRESEEHFAQLVAGVRDYAVFLIDRRGNVLSWNVGAERLKGYKPDEIVGQHFSRFYPAEAVSSGWPAHELELASANGRFEEEGWRVRKDGSRFWASVAITPLRDEAGGVRAFLKITRDLTDRQQAEEQARRLHQADAARKAAEAAAEEIDRQRQQLEVTLASIGDGVVVTDREGHVTFLNPVAAGLTGWEAQEATGQPLGRVFRIVNEETRRPVENPVTRVLREGVVVGLANHTVLIARNGREVPIDDCGAPIRAGGGAVNGAVLVFRDVTEARRAAEARSYLAAIVESSDDAIIGKTLDGRIASWNRGAERLYGYSAAEIVGKPLSTLVPPEHPDELPAIMDRVRRGEHIDHFETVRVRKDGSRVEVSLTISPIWDTEGKVVGASKIARDITARKEDERRRTEFLALLAHELRNPLAPLRNSLEVMRLAGDNPEAVEQARSMMHRQLQHLTRLVDDLLDVSRISRGKLQLRKERVPLAAVVRHALDVCEGMAKQNGHDLTVTLPDEPVYVDADTTRLAQAVCNLLSNAVKYSDPGSRVWLTVRREGADAVISVRDVGVGIPAEMLPRVFDMFVQVDRTLERAHGGLGVGLSIAKRLVEAHGGTVEARSPGYGHGSEFVIRLPVVRATVYELSEGGPRPGAAGGRRILVVDDNRDAAASLAMMLKIMGHEVRTAHDGLAGVEAAAASRPDVILLDIGMPKLNGYDACRRIRAEPWGQDVFIVAVTGWGQDEDKRRSLEAGFDHHLTKPVEPADLERVLLASRTGAS
jgi:PAS domain S-box-containing protein